MIAFATLSARLDELLSDAFEAWRMELEHAGPEVEALAALHDGLQKTQWAIRRTGAPAAPAKPTAVALPLFPEEP